MADTTEKTEKIPLKVAPTIGLTPLMFAAAMEDSTSYTELLQNGADPYKKNHSGSTAAEIKQFKYNERHAPLTPAEMISLSPHMQQPFPPTNQTQHLLQPNMVPGVSPTPQNMFLQRVRHSSNVSPAAIPLMSPLSPIFLSSPFPSPSAPQFFFPSEFPPNGVPPNTLFVMSPLAPPPSPMNFSGGSFVASATNSFLNHRLAESFNNVFVYSPQHNIVNESS
ncbi:unnamed protein product [Callosobruchus maculatus]|uniref:Uncharacterized protein n=1 Tax=Callosobruchus maculatus TaxID=64391 RepID=A0A653BV55_CALMS|nr:unnamed protein product [Callosobruchus maculatus]